MSLHGDVDLTNYCIPKTYAWKRQLQVMRQWSTRRCTLTLRIIRPPFQSQRHPFFHIIQLSLSTTVFERSCVSRPSTWVTWCLCMSTDKCIFLYCSTTFKAIYGNYLLFSIHAANHRMTLNDYKWLLSGLTQEGNVIESWNSECRSPSQITIWLSLLCIA